MANIFKDVLAIVGSKDKLTLLKWNFAKACFGRYGNIGVPVWRNGQNTAWKWKKFVILASSQLQPPEVYTPGEW